MKDRLPWFRCYSEKLLGALSAMPKDQGYMYVAVILRIYETGGPIRDSARALGRRIDMSERVAAAALEGLAQDGNITFLGDGRIDSASTHEELEHQQESRRNPRVAAGKASAAKRAEAKPETRQKITPENLAEKHQRNQQSGATVVQLMSPDKEKEIRQGGTTSLPNAGRARATYPPNAFDVFWAAYPIQKKELFARRAFEEVIASDLVAFADLMAGVERYRQTKPVDRKWMFPETFLRSGSWSDGADDGPPTGHREPQPTGQAARAAELHRLSQEEPRHELDQPAGQDLIEYDAGDDDQPVGSGGEDRGVAWSSGGSGRPSEPLLRAAGFGSIDRRAAAALRRKKPA